MDQRNVHTTQQVFLSGYNPIEQVTAYTISADYQSASADGPVVTQPTGQVIQPNARREEELKERLLMVQQQLIYLLHAYKCSKQQQKQPNAPACNVPDCTHYKQILLHISNCHSGRTCSYPSCFRSKQILNHWKQCSTISCPICSLFKFRDGQKQVNELDPTAAVALQDVSIPAANAARGMRQSAAALSELAGAFPISAESEKQWHKTITHFLRDHLVQKLVQTIFPTTDSSVLRDPRMNTLIQFAKRVERDMFLQANSQDEYYHLIAEKIYRIEKELEEKKSAGERQEADREQPPEDTHPLIRAGLQFSRS